MKTAVLSEMGDGVNQMEMYRHLKGELSQRISSVFFFILLNDFVKSYE